MSHDRPASDCGDVVFVTPGCLPVHVPDALQGMRGYQRNPR